jgi:histidyl-tRNA synthetase
MQCDFGTIGTRSNAADIETALVIHDLMRAIGFNDFTIHVNNRMVLTGLLQRLELAGKSTEILRALDKLPKIGSVCSGGRYDNLAELYTRQELPGIGASLGLDRLLAAMEELGMVEKVTTPAPVLIPYFDAARLHDYLKLAAQLRSAGIGVEVFCEPKKLGQQLKYADRRGFRIALIAGENEFAEGRCQIKDLENGTRRDVPLDEGAASLIAAVQEISG